MQDTSKKIFCPRGEQIWLRYYNHDGELLFMLTSKVSNRDYYYLYEVKEGSLEKLGRARTPIELEDKFDQPPYNVYSFRVRKDDKITLKGSAQKWGK